MLHNPYSNKLRKTLWLYETQPKSAPKLRNLIGNPPCQRWRRVIERGDYLPERLRAPCLLVRRRELEHCHRSWREVVQGDMDHVRTGRVRQPVDCEAASDYTLWATRCCKGTSGCLPNGPPPPTKVPSLRLISSSQDTVKDRAMLFSGDLRRLKVRIIHLLISIKKNRYPIYF